MDAGWIGGQLEARVLTEGEKEVKLIEPTLVTAAPEDPFRAPMMRKHLKIVQKMSQYFRNLQLIWCSKSQLPQPSPDHHLHHCRILPTLFHLKFFRIRKLISRYLEPFFSRTQHKNYMLLPWKPVYYLLNYVTICICLLSIVLGKELG